MIRPILTSVAALLLVATPAGADIVKLANGRLMTIDRAVFEGDVVVLMMRGGGEIRAPKSMVAELMPDEIPFAKTVAIEALAASPTVTRARLEAGEIRAMVDRIAARVGLDRRLAHAVVSVESNYEPLAISAKGAMGLMQLMPSVARQYNLADPFDPESNLEAGMRHLLGLLTRFDRSRALAAYNAGEGAVAKYGGVPPYRETQDYVKRIMALVK